MNKLCPECGQTGEGNFCSNCGCRLVTEDVYEEQMIRKVERSLNPEPEKTIYVRKSREEVREPRRSAAPAERYDEYDEYEDCREEYPEDEDGLLSPDMDSERLGSALTKGLRRVSELICTVLRWICAALMGCTALYMAWCVLGDGITGRRQSSLGGLLRGAGVIYLGAGLLLLLYCFVQILWILRIRRMVNGAGDRRKEDPGHGMFGFASFLALYIAAPFLLMVLPEGGEAVKGVGALLETVGEMELLPGMQVIGLILCLLRRIVGTANW